MSARSTAKAKASPITADQLLAASRAMLKRLSAAEALAAQRRRSILVDIRSDSQRARDGVVPGAREVSRNVLEWRCDPSSPHRDPELARTDVQLVLICDEGFQSSLAAATLQRFGLTRATDVIGGFRAWQAAGLPVVTGSAVAQSPGCAGSSARAARP